MFRFFFCFLFFVVVLFVFLGGFCWGFSVVLLFWVFLFTIFKTLFILKCLYFQIRRKRKYIKKFNNT